MSGYAVINGQQQPLANTAMLVQPLASAPVLLEAHEIDSSTGTATAEPPNGVTYARVSCRLLWLAANQSGCRVGCAACHGPADGTSLAQLFSNKCQAPAPVQYRFTVKAATTLVFEVPTRTATFTGLDSSTQVGMCAVLCVLPACLVAACLPVPAVRPTPLHPLHPSVLVHPLAPCSMRFMWRG